MTWEEGCTLGGGSRLLGRAILSLTCMQVVGHQQSHQSSGFTFEPTH
jgi:hypothetical protein